MFAPTADRLDSWKEIAAYLRRSVRTVRRWERDEGLPVHRQMHRSLGSVYAYRSEIDAWRERQERTARTSAPAAAPATAGAAAQGRSIAVLPFSYLGPASGDEYLAEGFTEEVIAALSRLRNVRVISRTSSMALRGTSQDAGAIARALQVRHLLEGTVRHHGNRLRVSARLIDAARDDRLWADTFEGTLDDVLAIQERIAREIVRALEVELTPEEDRRLAERPIADAVAWRCVMQARQEALRWRRDSIDHAVRLLHNGLTVVGDNAELHAALGRAYLQYREAGIDVSEGPLEQAERCVRKVFAIDPGSAAGLRLRGWIHYSRGRIQDAVRDLSAALETDWNDPDTLGLLSNCYLISGRVAAARPLIETLLSIDPLTPLNRCLRGWADALEGDFIRAIGPYREMFEMDPANPLARLFYTWVLAGAGREQEAQRIAAGFPAELSDALPARIAALLVRGLAGSSRTPGAGRPGDASSGGGPRGETPLPDEAALLATTEMFPRFLAEAYALQGDAERAVRWLAVAVDRGFVNYPYLARHDPFLRRIEGDPGFVALLRTVRSRWRAQDQ